MQRRSNSLIQLKTLKYISCFIFGTRFKANVDVVFCCFGLFLISRDKHIESMAYLRHHEESSFKLTMGIVISKYEITTP